MVGDGVHRRDRIGLRLELLVVALAVFRITRLLTTDDVLTVPRDLVHVRGGWWSRVLDCDWCASMYVGTVAAVVFYIWPGPTYWLSLPFAFSAVAGLLTSIFQSDS